jgi:hypothetical protein
VARPADQEKSAAYLARQARNSANYRARVKAAKLGVPVPEHARQQQPAHYRPPRVSGDIERAIEAREQRRQTRAQIIESLPDVRNERVRLRAKEITERGLPERKSSKGRARQAEAIRENARADLLQSLGKSRKGQLLTALYDGPASERLQENMTAEQRHQFQRLSERIAKGSHQSIAILFEYAGGAGDYASALDKILGSPESRDVDEGLGQLQALAERADVAAKLYAPSAINPNTGRKIGRLTV